MSSKVRLLIQEPVDSERFGQGSVVLWPATTRRDGKPPLRLRLIRVRGRRRRKSKARPVDVWLLTNFEPKRLSAAQASRFYRLRWENEGLFRTYKRTLA